MCISLTRNNKFNEGLSSVFMTVTTLCHNPVTVNNDLQQSYFRDFTDTFGDLTGVVLVFSDSPLTPTVFCSYLTLKNICVKELDSVLYTIKIFHSFIFDPLLLFEMSVRVKRLSQYQHKYLKTFSTCRFT